MKARTRKTRWLLITLLLGFLAAAGVTFVLHQHPGRLLVSANGIVPPDDTPVQSTDTASSVFVGDEEPAQTPTTAGSDHYIARGKYSNSTQPDAANDSYTPSSTSGGANSAGTNQPTDSTSDSSGGTQPQTRGPSSTTDTTTPPQATGTGEYANGGYLPDGCGLPAGCGGGGSEIVQSSGTSGGTPSLHNSQGSGPPTDNSDPQTDNSNPPTDNSDPPGQGSGNPGQKSNPPSPGPDSSVAAAPELDPATLAGALTLLLGSLAIVRSRRVRAKAR